MSSFFQNKLNTSRKCPFFYKKVFRK